MSFEITQADAFAWLAQLPDASVDLICTDPPYESLDKWRAIGTTTRLTAEGWFPTIRNAQFAELFAQFYRVLRPLTHCYVMCDAETAFAVAPYAQQAGFKFWKPLIWHKTGSPGLGYHYRTSYEFVLFFEKGTRPWRPEIDMRWKGRRLKGGVADVIPCKRVRGGYPTEKPVDLLRTLIEQSTQPGELVIDPFMGSGSCGIAALQLGREFMGCDSQLRAYDLAALRLTTYDANQ